MVEAKSSPSGWRPKSMARWHQTSRLSVNRSIQRNRGLGFSTPARVVGVGGRALVLLRSLHEQPAAITLQGTNGLCNACATSRRMGRLPHVCLFGLQPDSCMYWHILALWVDGLHPQWRHCGGVQHCQLCFRAGRAIADPACGQQRCDECRRALPEEASRAWHELVALTLSRCPTQGSAR